MYDTCNNPTTTYVEVSNRFESSTSGRFGNNNSRSKPKIKSRVYNTRYLRFGWTRRPPSESKQKRKGHSLSGTDHRPQSADNQQQAKIIVRNRFKGFKRANPDTPLTVAQPLDPASKIGKKTTAKTRSLPRFPIKLGQSVLTAKTSATMNIFRTSEKSVNNQVLLLPEASGDNNQTNHPGEQMISTCRKDQNLGDTCF